MERRNFILKLSGLTAGILLPGGILPGRSLVNRDRLGDLLPLRKLGKTGANVTMLGLGGYHIGWTTEKDAQETIEAALEGGIRFFDTAEGYGPNISEEKYGRFLTPKYRNEIFLMTKTLAKNANTAREHLDASLKRLKTDYLDLWQAHAISSKEDADARINNGVFGVMQEAKASGKVRHIGFTGHTNAGAHAYLLEKLRPEGFLETVQMPVNPVDAAHPVSFVQQVIPAAFDQGLGIIAMKTLGGGQFFALKAELDKKMWETDDPVVPGRIRISDAMNFAWSLPISVLVTGASTSQMVKEKIKMAKKHMVINEEERKQLIARVVDLSLKEKVEYYRNRN
ncbi:MAG TPA: aldo/keto reductase [Cyclobacteriaceae bacterium]|nr:aldo/keto reductase [Cyclobacteriaceae bacterium]